MSDYTPYTEEIANIVKDIKKNMLKIIKKVNGNTINDRIYLQNIYLKISKDELKTEGVFSAYSNRQSMSVDSNIILKNYVDSYYIIKSIVFFGNDELTKPIMSKEDNYYVNLQLFFNNAYNVVDVNTKIGDRIKFYKTKDTIDSIYEMFINKSSPFKENPYLVRIDYNEYYPLDKDSTPLDKKTANGYFNILFSKKTINNISNNLESIKLFSNSLFMYNKVSNKCTGTYRIIDNEKIIKQAVSNNVCTLQYAPDNLKNDVDVLYSGMSSNNDTIDVLSNFWTTYVHGDKFLTEKLLERNGLFLQYDNWGIETDKPTVLIAVKSNGMALEYSSEELQNDREVVFAAVTQNGIALQYASKQLQNDRAVVLAAITQNGMALEYASNELQNDREVVLAAITKNGMALSYTSDALKADKNLVLTAVTNNGFALESSLVYQGVDDLENYNQLRSESFP